MYGNYGVESNNLIIVRKRLPLLLSMLFNTMLIYGYSANNLFVSTIISITKDVRPSLIIIISIYLFNVIGIRLQKAGQSS